MIEVKATILPDSHPRSMIPDHLQIYIHDEKEGNQHQPEPPLALLLPRSNVILQSPPLRLLGHHPSRGRSSTTLRGDNGHVCVGRTGGEGGGDPPLRGRGGGRNPFCPNPLPEPLAVGEKSKGEGTPHNPSRLNTFPYKPDNEEFSPSGQKLGIVKL